MSRSGSYQVALTAIGLAFTLGLGACSKHEEASNAPQATAPQATEAEAPKVEPKREWASLDEAVAALAPMFSDEHGNLSPGAAVLASWGAKRLKWDELQKLPQTKVALVMKDSEQERGKRICTSGSIIEIAAEEFNGDKFFIGGMFGESSKIYRFVAIGSTGELVDRSRARFCGVVIGRFDYPNSAGGTAHAVQLVGMFDLPQNKATPPAL
jgi:hypothetical protein